MQGKFKIWGMIFLILFIITGLLACTKAAPSTPTSPQPSASPNNVPPSGPIPSGPGIPPGGLSSSGPPAGLPPGGLPTAIPKPATPAITIRGQGTVTVASYANLYFGTAGQIARINIKQGDRVTKGTVLARLDTSNLESALAQARVNLDQSRLAQTQAESSLAAAQFNLDRTRAVSEIKDEITKIQWMIQVAELRIQESTSISEKDASDYWLAQIKSYRIDLDKQNEKLADLLDNEEYTGTGALTYNIMGQTYDRLTVEDVRMKQLAIEVAQQTLYKSQSTITQAQKNLDLAQQQLNQATIIAPFDGLVATLNGTEGDILPAPAQSQRPVIYLIDPATLELNIQVNELDVPKVKLGQKAAINIDAFPNMKLEGTVSKISLLPVLQGGIVDYNVTVTFQAPSSTDVRIGMNATATMMAG